jgi:hypothetical protein
VIYLYWYLGIGVVVLYFWMLAHHGGSAHSVLPRPRRTGWRKAGANILDYGIGVALLAPFWPVLVFVKIKERVVGASPVLETKKREFAVTQSDLQAQMSVLQVEEQEMVFDPLDAVPRVPFGHLNAAWKQFIGNMAPDDRLWSFVAYWTSDWGNKELRQGYVIVRGEEIHQHFTTVLKFIEENTEGKKIRGARKRGPDIPSWLRKLAD